MEFMLFILVVFVVYIAAMIGVTNFTMDRLNACSGLFGAGIVNMFTGFIMYNVMKTIELGGLSPVVLILLYGFLIMGLSGIVMIAVDLLNAINQLSSWVSRMNEKKSAVQDGSSFTGKAPSAQQGKIPTWKRIQMEQEGK